MRKYNYKLAKKIIENEKSNLAEASLGMHEDWFWTAVTIWEHDEYKNKIYNGKKIEGIEGSTWATPTLQLVYKDGKIRMIPCYRGTTWDDKPSHYYQLISGPLSSVVQANIKPLEEYNE